MHASVIPLPEQGDSYPNSTAIRHTSRVAPLWFHRPTQEARTDKTPVLTQSCRVKSVRIAMLRAPIRSACRVYGWPVRCRRDLMSAVRPHNELLPLNAL